MLICFVKKLIIVTIIERHLINEFNELKVCNDAPGHSTGTELIVTMNNNYAEDE